VCYENTFAVFAHHAPVFDLLLRVHRTFDLVLGIAANTEPKWVAMFAVRAHAAWLAAVRLAASGQVAESYAPVRTAIEIGWYGLHAATDPDESQRMATWLRRDDSNDARFDVVKAFQSGKLKATHRARDPETAQALESLYERAIGLGAHPNPTGFLTSLIRDENDETITHNVLLLNPQPLPMMVAIKTAVEIAVGLLRIFGLLYPQQYADANVPRLLEDIIARLNTVFQPYAPSAG
jgi:hypothetical protein